jgi:hypothetical protein
MVCETDTLAESAGAPIPTKRRPPFFIVMERVINRWVGDYCIWTMEGNLLLVVASSGFHLGSLSSWHGDLMFGPSVRCHHRKIKCVVELFLKFDAWFRNRKNCFYLFETPMLLTSMDRLYEKGNKNFKKIVNYSQ